MNKNLGFTLLSATTLVAAQSTEGSAPAYRPPEGTTYSSQAGGYAPASGPPGGTSYSSSAGGYAPASGPPEGTTYSTFADGDPPEAMPILGSESSEPYISDGKLGVSSQEDPTLYTKPMVISSEPNIGEVYPEYHVDPVDIDVQVYPQIEPVPMPAPLPHDYIAENGCPSSTTWQTYQDPECREPVLWQHARTMPQYMGQTCTDPFRERIADLLYQKGYKKFIVMVEEEGSDTVEFYNRLKDMGWNVGSITEKPDGSGQFLGTLKKWLYSDDYRLIANLIGLDVSSAPSSSVQIKCPTELTYVGIDIFTDSYLCNTKPQWSTEVPLNQCTHLPEQDVYMLISRGSTVDPDGPLPEPLPEPIPLPAIGPTYPIFPYEPGNFTGCSSDTKWQIFKDQECSQEVTDWEGATDFPTYLKKTCTDPDLQLYQKVLSEYDVKGYLNMVQTQGEDTKEFYYQLQDMGWNLEVVGYKPDGSNSGLFVKAIVAILKSKDYRKIAKLIGAETPKSRPVVQVQCSFDWKFMLLQAFTDSSFCQSELIFSTQLFWYTCHQIPDEKYFIKLIPGPDQFQVPYDYPVHYDYDIRPIPVEYQIDPVEPELPNDYYDSDFVDREDVIYKQDAPISYAPDGIPDSEKAYYSGLAQAEPQNTVSMASSSGVEYESNSDLEMATAEGSFDKNRPQCVSYFQEFVPGSNCLNDTQDGHYQLYQTLDIWQRASFQCTWLPEYNGALEVQCDGQYIWFNWFSDKECKTPSHEAIKYKYFECSQQTIPGSDGIDTSFIPDIMIYPSDQNEYTTGSKYLAGIWSLALVFVTIFGTF